MRINERLMRIGSKIPECKILADIGTDHAYIPIYAVKNRLCEKAIAVDLRSGPLKMAQKNIKRCGLEESIEIRQGNGMEPIMHSECDAIVIAGMGGSLIKDILSASAEKSKIANMLLLQPNTAAEALREWLYENGYDIIDEVLALDAGKIYCIMCAKWTGIRENKDRFAYFIGEKLFEGNDPLLQSYLLKKKKVLDKIITGRSKSSRYGVNETAGIAGLDTAVCIDIRDRINSYLETYTNTCK